MLTRVSEKERTMLLLWVEGFAHKEIAEVVGTTTATVAPTIARALKKMSKQIDEFMREDVR
jgi:DNA-directed RNA polymerase specialized sigma24 family protein